MIIGAYTLDLYCDNNNKKNHVSFITGSGGRCFEVDAIEIMWQFVGETFSECAKQARYVGWLINRKKKRCLCPACNGRIKKEIK